MTNFMSNSFVNIDNINLTATSHFYERISVNQISDFDVKLVIENEFETFENFDQFVKNIFSFTVHFLVEFFDRDEVKSV